METVPPCSYNTWDSIFAALVTQGFVSFVASLATDGGALLFGALLTIPCFWASALALRVYAGRPARWWLLWVKVGFIPSMFIWLPLAHGIRQFYRTD